MHRARIAYMPLHVEESGEKIISTSNTYVELYVIIGLQAAEYIPATT